jgi:hypothetical protein
MDPFETVMWRSAADPRLRSPLTLIEILDQAPDAGGGSNTARLRPRHDGSSGHGSEHGAPCSEPPESPAEAALLENLRTHQRPPR